VALHLRQVEGGPIGEVGIHLGDTDWSERLRQALAPRLPQGLPMPPGLAEVVDDARLTLPVAGGRIDLPYFFLVSDASRGAVLWLPLAAGDRPALMLRIDCDRRSEGRFEITQHNEDGRVVGGFDVVLG
jgi:hypothetical protein